MKFSPADIEKLYSRDPKVKFGFGKELLALAKERPAELYPYFDEWVKLLSSDNSLMVWTATDIIGYLSAVDKDNKTASVLDKLVKLLHGGKLITCNHAIFALGLIAQEQPQHRDRIIGELLAISGDTFDTEECKAIATGKALLAFQDMPTHISSYQPVLNFIQNARHSQRNATRKKAEALLKKLEKTGT